MRDKIISILGYDVYAGPKADLAPGAAGVIATLNPHSYIIARKDKQFREALQSADLLIPDGTGIQLAARVLTGEEDRKNSRVGPARGYN